MPSRRRVLVLVQEEPARGGAGLQVDQVATPQLDHLEARTRRPAHQSGRSPAAPGTALLVDGSQVQRVVPGVQPGPGQSRRRLVVVDGQGHLPEPLHPQPGEAVVVTVDPQVGIGVGPVEQAGPGLVGHGRGQREVGRVGPGQHPVEGGRPVIGQLQVSRTRVVEAQGGGMQEQPGRSRHPRTARRPRWACPGRRRAPGPGGCARCGDARPTARRRAHRLTLEVGGRRPVALAHLGIAAGPEGRRGSRPTSSS